MNNKLNVLLSDLVVFYHKLQNKHWYVSGQSFFQIHPELENLYDAVSILQMNAGYENQGILPQTCTCDSIRDAREGEEVICILRRF